VKADTIRRYLRRAAIVAECSPDKETQVGAILLSGNTRSVVSEGYNGFIRGATNENLPTTRPDKYQYMIHAETNLVCNAARNQVSTLGGIVFITHTPCINCIRLLYQAGIQEIYFSEEHASFQVVRNSLDFTVQFTTESFYTKITIEPK